MADLFSIPGAEFFVLRKVLFNMYGKRFFPLVVRQNLLG